MKITLFSILTLFAATAAVADPVASDDFSAAELSKSWTAAKGTWKNVDGKLSGAELASDEHAAVVFYNSPHTDSKVKFSFELAGSDKFMLSFNHPKGHLFRVAISETEVQLNIDKDKKDPKSKPVRVKTVEANFEQGKTYTMTLETVGDKAMIEFDNGIKLEGTHPALAKEKTGYRLVLKGKGVKFDDFVILSQK